MEWYKVVKTIRGRRYLYWQKTYREGKHVRTLNQYIGPINNAILTAKTSYIEEPMTNDDIEQLRTERLARAQKRAERRLKWAASAHQKADQARDKANTMADAIPFGQPILVGHHSEKSDRSFRNRIDANYRRESEERQKAEYHEQKADNILKYATRVAGDAERERQKVRDARDQEVSIGCQVKDAIFGFGEITKINKKTYTIKFGGGRTTTRDKSYVTIIHS